MLAVDRVKGEGRLYLRTAQPVLSADRSEDLVVKSWYEGADALARRTVPLPPITTTFMTFFFGP